MPRPLRSVNSASAPNRANPKPSRPTPRLSPIAWIRFVGNGPMSSVNRPIAPPITRNVETSRAHQSISFNGTTRSSIPRMVGPATCRRTAGDRGRLRHDLFEEAGLQQLLTVDREERVDAVADDAHHFALAPPGMPDDVALLE